MMQQFLVSFTAFFVAMDIIGAVPLYLSLTQELSLPAKKAIVRKSVLVAFLVAIAFAFVGQAVFKHLGITLSDFKVAGGIILLIIGLSDLLGYSSHSASGKTGIVPLAVPLITGPGLLTAVIIQIGSVGYPISLIAMVLNYLIAFFVLYYCDKITKVLGKDGTVVVSKIAALLLTAISVSMIRSGIVEMFKTASVAIN